MPMVEIGLMVVFHEMIIESKNRCFATGICVNKVQIVRVNTPLTSPLHAPPSVSSQEERLSTSPLERGKGLKENAQRYSFNRGVCHKHRLRFYPNLQIRQFLTNQHTSDGSAVRFTVCLLSRGETFYLPS